MPPLNPRSFQVRKLLAIHNKQVMEDARKILGRRPKTVLQAVAAVHQPQQAEAHFRGLGEIFFIRDSNVKGLKQADRTSYVEEYVAKMMADYHAMREAKK